MDTVNGRGPTQIIEPHPEGSVVEQPLPGEYGFGEFVIWLGSVADDIPAWGAMPYARDVKLRQFWPSEPVLAGAMFTMVSRYAAFGYTLDGPDRMVKIYNEMLNCAQSGQGWLAFIVPFTIDYLTQDNGGVIEFVRIDNNDPTSPVVTFNHLDSGRCVRTGRVKEPVIYYDRWGKPHLMKWWQVAAVSEMPSPIELMRGIGYCAVTRILRSAQIMRDTGVYRREKISGRFNNAIHLVSGVTSKAIQDALAKQKVMSDSQGLTRYQAPAIVASLDPNAKVEHALLEMASLPDNYDIDKDMKWYITQLSLAFGTDYQEFAPLSGGGMGGGQQGEVLHLKARGKGPKLFMENMETIFNWHGVLPRNVTFSYGDQDSGEDLDKTKVALLRAEERAMRLKSGELTPEIAVRMAIDAGDLDPKYADELIKQINEKLEADKKAAEDQLQLQKDKLDTAKDGMMKSPPAPKVDRGSA